MYYIRVVKIMYFDRSEAISVSQPSLALALFFSLTVVLNVFSVFYLDLAFYSTLSL